MRGSWGARSARRPLERLSGGGEGGMAAKGVKGRLGRRGGSCERERAGRSRNRDRLARNERPGAGPAGVRGDGSQEKAICD